MKMRARTHLIHSLPSTTARLYAKMCAALFEHVYESYPERNTGIHAATV